MQIHVGSSGAWCASVPELKGLHTYGNSYNHLLEMVHEAIEGWLETSSVDGCTKH